ncbi:hypothetical protein JL720_6362 [Aureococcus anophagefferens]|nr:hypothetical protein JL720_6362 [Aureococcus anophagefferens]
MARPRVVAAAAATLGVAGAHNFILHEAPLSWPDAAVACRAAGGRLAKVEDAAEQAVLATTMGSQAVWIGGSDGATEGVWAWDAEDGGVLPPSPGATQAFENWLTPDRAAAFPGCGGHAGESEPNDWGAGEDCMGAYEHCGLWFDANCADQRPYACEHPRPPRAACPEGWRGVGGRCFGLAGSGPRDECDARCAAALPPTWPAPPRDPDADDGWSGDGAAGWDAGCASADRYGYDGWAAGEPNQASAASARSSSRRRWRRGRRAPTAAPTPRAVAAAPDASCPLAFVPAAGTWADAEATCVSLGGHLATLPDAAASAYESAHFVRARGGCRPAWIGYNDREEEGVWAWADGSVGGYERWWPGEPDDSANGARGADCASMGVDCVHGWRGVADEWVDSGCDAAGADYTPRGALCQLRPLAAGDCAGAGGAGGGVCSANPCPAGVCAGTFTCDDAARFGYTCGMLEAAGYGCGGCACAADAAAAAAEAAWAAPDADDGEAAVVESQCHAAACGEYGSGGVDDDCCAAPDDAFCAEGYAALERVAPAAPVWVGGAGAGDAWRWSAGGAVDGFERWATADRAAATPGCGAWAGADADEPDEGAAACMAVHGGCGLWFDHPCDGKKAYVCEYADDAGGGEKGPEAAAGGGMMAVVVAVVIVLALLGGGAAAYAAKRRRGHAARGYGDVARGYEPDSDLPSYGDYVLNPISVSAGV